MSLTLNFKENRVKYALRSGNANRATETDPNTTRAIKALNKAILVHKFSQQPHFSLKLANPLSN